MRMRKNSTVHCALWRFCVPLLLLASFSYAPSVLATAEISDSNCDCPDL
ncbi:hypothetical protein GLYMA_15G239400v4 [Glycine max]|uniref:Uncharacterized protein n=1 Tax=Glycine max TaxID=3847 RepID=A0A0R0GCL7_SOYBN|nr:hypothetical protein GLYMA_15G239400v4 [Glycine max]